LSHVKLRKSDGESCLPTLTRKKFKLGHPTQVSFADEKRNAMFGSARSVRNPGGACAQHPNCLLQQRKDSISQAASISMLRRSIGPILGNYSLGRNLADADVADHKWLKVESNERERVVIEIISSSS
jgi:hypothetical protein